MDEWVGCWERLGGGVLTINKTVHTLCVRVHYFQQQKG